MLLKKVSTASSLFTWASWSLRPATKPEKAVLFDSKELALKKAKQNAKPKSDIFIFSESGSLIAEDKS